MGSSLKDKTQRLLVEMGRGNREAAAELLPHVYDELRGLAAACMRRRQAGQTLQPTALVHEAFLRLVDQSAAAWNDRAHFLNVAARAMRQVLIDHHRGRQAQKRGGGWRRISLAHVPAAAQPDVDVLALDEALTRLAALDERQARVVELRFFGGLSVEEIAAVLEVSKTTIEGDWRAARAWLARELRRGERA